MSIVLKDWYGKDQKFDHDKIFVRDENGELVQFTQGTGEPTLQDKTITENGTYTADEGFDGLGSVTVEVEGSSADVRYVTFKSYDGLTEYGKKAVAVGDDCADPIARGIFDTPTRESDAQYDYTHVGWAAEPNGEPDANWNKVITEDKTVYAAFASAVRYYTITYYDNDGVTVLNTESVAYGSIPSYKPTKDGYVLIGWSPSLTAVTGDASYIANWTDDVSFAAADWSVIRAVLENGQAKTWAVGDTRTIPVKAYDGTVMNVDFEIRSLTDNSAIIVSKTAFSTALWSESGSTISFNTAGDNGWYAYSTGKLRHAYNEVVFNGFPDDMQELISARQNATYTKTSDSGAFGNYVTSDKVWIPSLAEMRSWYSDNNSRIKKEQTKTGIGSAVNYATRDMRSYSYVRPSYVDTIGQVINTNSTTPYTVNIAPIAMLLKVA